MKTIFTCCFLKANPNFYSFGFVQFYQFSSCENCIRGFFYLGYQASFAQKSRNSRLKELEDKSSTNIYCTNIPIDWTEAVRC
jgi:NADPH-ferrihemoprotein reductase